MKVILIFDFGEISREQNRDAFTELYKRYEQAVYNLSVFLTRDEKAAQQVVKDTFLIIWENAEAVAGTNVKKTVLKLTAKRSLLFSNDSEK